MFDPKGGSIVEILLTQKDKYQPENCRTTANFFLIYEYLYYQREWKRIYNNERNDPPKSLCTKVEGKPGTGKTFVRNTLRNMTG